MRAANGDKTPLKPNQFSAICEAWSQSSHAHFKSDIITPMQQTFKPSATAQAAAATRALWEPATA